MMFRKVAGPVRLLSQSNGSVQIHSFDPVPGGRMIRRAQYMLKVLQVSSANVRVGVDLEHGPDGRITTLHSTPIPFSDPGGLLPTLFEGTANDATSMIGEWLQPVIKVKDNTATGQEWAVVELYELRKPF